MAICAAVIGAALLGPWFWRGLLTVICACALVELGRLRASWVVFVFVFLSLLLMVYMYALVGRWPVLWYIFIIWASDVGAYLVGSTMGLHKLCPKISPLKTWEGALGGFVAGVGTGIAAAYATGSWSVWFWIGLAVVASVTGVLGDLAESMLKRRAGVKDSGHMLPGHGGMLDRFDALIFSSPFVFIYFMVAG